jgi:hypothetical protein
MNTLPMRFLHRSLSASKFASPRFKEPEGAHDVKRASWLRLRMGLDESLHGP